MASQPNTQPQGQTENQSQAMDGVEEEITDV